MLVNLDFKLKNLDGVEFEATAAKILAGELCNKPAGIDVLKAWEWACNLQKDGQLTLDSVDAEALENAVRQSPQLTNLGAAQILLAIKAAKN